MKIKKGIVAVMFGLTALTLAGCASTHVVESENQAKQSWWDKQEDSTALAIHRDTYQRAKEYGDRLDDPTMANKVELCSVRMAMTAGTPSVHLIPVGPVEIVVRLPDCPNVVFYCKTSCDNGASSCGRDNKVDECRRISGEKEVRSAPASGAPADFANVLSGKITLKQLPTGETVWVEK
jgi:hypothetical protein